MAQHLLAITRELTEGGAGYLAVRHLQCMAETWAIDLVVTGPISQGMVANLPSNIRVAQQDKDPRLTSLDVLDLRLHLKRERHLFESREYDTVLGFSLFPDALACAGFSIARSSRKVLVLLDEGLLTPGLPAPVVAAMRGALVTADHLSPVSQGLLDKLTITYPWLQDRSHCVVPPPLEEQRTLPRPSPFNSGGSAPDQLHLVTAARLTPGKGILTCLWVHRKLRRLGYSFHWHVLGDGRQRPWLEILIKVMRMGDQFHLEGFRPDVRHWMRHADLFVLASRSEGCPTVILEALAEGTPVLSTDVCGARELINDGTTGRVVPQSQQALALALADLLADPISRLRYRQAIKLANRLPPQTRPEQQLMQLLTSQPEPPRKPLISILIPTFNQADLISKAIDSALMQDHPNFEVVVCDDASTDHTVERVKQYQFDKRLRLYVNETNRGRTKNYRAALERATGDWILMLDGDDYLLDPSFLSKATTALSSHHNKRPVFVQAGHRVTWCARSKANAQRASIDILPAIATETTLMTGSEYLDFVFRTGFFTHLGTLYQREAALRCDFYRLEISSSDMDSLLRLSLMGPVVILRSIAGCWLQHGNNASSKVPLKHVEENVRIFRTIAHEASSSGLLAMQHIEPQLTRYEARVLACLLGTASGQSIVNFRQAGMLAQMILRINPRLYFQPTLLRSLAQGMIQQTRLRSESAIIKVKIGLRQWLKLM